MSKLKEIKLSLPKVKKTEYIEPKPSKGTFGKFEGLKRELSKERNTFKRMGKPFK